MKKITILITILFFFGLVQAQKDREFWFAVPDITSGDYGADNSILLTFVSYDNPTTIHITQPQVLGFPNIDTTCTLPPNSCWVFDVAAKYKPQVEVPAGMAYPYGLHMTSDQDFSVYYANTSNNSEIYTLKGKNALGTKFIVPMQYEYVSGSYASAHNSIQIVATEDNTTVEVELFQRTTDMLQTSDHQTITIQLDKGWAYAFHSYKDRNCPGNEHLHNTRITSDKPIAVNSTDDSVEPGDLVGDQIIPVSLYGTSYIAVKNQGNIEKAYIFPSENNTNIYVDGVLQAPALNLGDKMMIPLTSVATYLTSDKPVNVFQITTKTSARELGGAVLPKLECTGSMETAYRPAFIRNSDGSLVTGSEIYFNIITKTGNINDFTINGQSGVITASDFAPVPGNPQWAYCRKNLSSFARQSGNDVLRLKNSKGYFHVAAYDNPSNNSCTFGYFSDYHAIKFNAATSLSNYSSNDTIRLFMENADAFTNITWTKPDGTVVVSDELEITNPTKEDAGFYIVSGTSKDGCVVEGEGVVVVNFVESQKDSLSVCEGEEVTLHADGYAPYKWTPGSGSQNADSLKVSPSFSTVYTVENHKIAHTIVYNGDFQKGNTLFAGDYTYGGTTSTAVTSPGSYSVWRNAKETNSAYNRIYDHTTNNSTDGRFLIANCTDEAGKKIWKKEIDVVPNMQYEFAAWFVKAIRNGDTPLLRFSVNNQAVGNVIIPTDPSTVPSSDSWKQFSCLYQNDVSTTITIAIEIANESPSGAGVCVDDITFAPLLAITDTFSVDIVQKPSPVISGDSILCHGTATLDAGADSNGNDFTSYGWYNSDDAAIIVGTDRTLTVNQSGTYMVIVNNGACENSDSKKVLPGDSLGVVLDENEISICSNEPYFSIKYTVTDGNPQLYSILYDIQAHTAGLTDLIDQPLTPNEIQIPLSGTVQSGFYNATLVIKTIVGCAADFESPILIDIQTDPNQLMEQKWNDVIALFNKNYNGGLEFIAYQWYKNGEILSGETGSYLYLKDDVLRSTDYYNVLLTLTDSTQFMTCSFIPEDRSSGDLGFPTLVNVGQIVKVNGLLIGKMYQITLLNLNGLVYSTQNISADNPTFAAPKNKGIYILNVRNENVVKKYKIMVQ